MTTNLAQWLLASEEPWTRYRTLVDLLDRPEMLAHPRVQVLVTTVTSWPGYALKRHNDAKRPLHALSTLADFGVRAGDPGMQSAIEAVQAHQSPEGRFRRR